MTSSDKVIFGRNVRRYREALRMTQENLADASELDRSYIGGVERGERNPTLTAILRLAVALEIPPAYLFESAGESISVPDSRMQREMFEGIREDAPISGSTEGMIATDTESGLLIQFRYDQYDAKYLLSGAKKSEFNEVLSVLKKGLASRNSRADAVAKAFLAATRLWPDANPSDLWTFLINRAYCDRSNHPSDNVRLNLEQSWKRTSGWALEKVLVEHYGTFLKTKGLTIKIGSKAEKVSFLSTIDDSRIVPDKADVLISFVSDGIEKLLGVVHVKASIAERRTDDVPMSRALIEADFLSVFWTMDAKSYPSNQPVNRGEFGETDHNQVSDKRRDFEEHGHFSACFSYNKNTVPTSDNNNAQARIFVCNFTDPDDDFSRFLISAHCRPVN